MKKITLGNLFKKKYDEEIEDHYKIDADELFSTCAARIEDYPTISLAGPVTKPYSKIAQLRLSETLKHEGVADGDILLIQRNSISDLVSDCARDIRERGVRYSLMRIRNADDFLRNLGYIDDSKGLSISTVTVHGVGRRTPQRGATPKRAEVGAIAKGLTLAKRLKARFWGQSSEQLLSTPEMALWGTRRPQVALLYTDEDFHIASYVRTHFESLDKASGSYCDVLCIENPKAIGSDFYWRTTLDEISYLVWKSLGWEKSKPYNKADVYELARTFHIPLDMLPCALILKDGRIQRDSITRLEGDITAAFRRIFSSFSEGNNFAGTNSNYGKKDDYKKENQRDSAPICFLSHNSNDKNLVRKVAASLHTFGIDTWFDEWEILPGDSVVAKIEEGLRKSSHLVLFLSRAAVSSQWVVEEMNTALYHAISTNQLKIIPVLVEECEVPMLIASYSFIRKNDPREIATNIQHAVLGITRKPPVVIKA